MIEPREERDLFIESDATTGNLVKEFVRLRILRAYTPDNAILAVRILIISFYFIILSLLNARAMTFRVDGKAKSQANRNKKSGRRLGRKFGGSRKKNGWVTILHNVRGEIFQPACFTYVSYTTSGG